MKSANSSPSSSRARPAPAPKTAGRKTTGTKRPGIALIGCGRIGFMLESDPLRHKPCTHWGGASAAGLEINLACDINGDRLKRFAGQAGIPADGTFPDYRELLRRARPEMVIVASWTETHADVVMRACRGGARVIICEKPMASSLPAARRMLAACRENGVSLIINHERRYDGRYRKAGELIRDGRIGTIKTVFASILTSGYHGPSRLEEGGGPLLHDGTHMIDILRLLFGEIRSAEGEFQRAGRSRGYEDRAAAWLRTESGIDIFLEAGGSRRYFQFELEIYGTEGKIVIGNGYERLYTAQRSKWYTGFRDLREVPFPKFPGENCFLREYREAGRILKGGKEKISSTGEDGCRALEVIHAVYLSSHMKGKKIELPLPHGIIDLKKIFGL